MKERERGERERVRESRLRLGVTGKVSEILFSFTTITGNFID